jgi:dTDP-4-amino-4,6-dideoxygalactose transaminase
MARTVFKEIGSNFWLEPEELELCGTRDRQFHYLNKNEHAVYTSSGRGAISLVLENIHVARRVVLLPLYTCDSVIMPFLNKGYDVYFYGVSDDLAANKDEFAKSVEKYGPGVVLLHAYFGFDTLRRLRPLYSRLRERGIIVIEDITHSLFSAFSKEGADFYVASLRKWFALPDGGVAIPGHDEFDRVPKRGHEELVAVNVRAIRLKDEYTKSMRPELKEEYRRLFYSTEAMLDRDCGVYAMSETARSILSRMDFQALAEVRRRNFKYLLDHLPRDPRLVPVFAELPAGVAPLYFPVFVDGDRAKLRAFLAEAEIYAPVHWEIPAACSPHSNEASAYVYQHILSIPCDQRYADRDMERILRRLSVYQG